MKKFKKSSGGEASAAGEEKRPPLDAGVAADEEAITEKIPTVEEVHSDGEVVPEAESAGAETANAEIEKMAAELQALQQKYIYLQAEYQNYRKRVSRDLAETRLNAVSGTLSPFLNVFDFLSMAENAAEKSDNIESIRQGLKMIIQQFFKTFDELGVRKLESVGAKFDPERQEAVANEDSDTVPEGEVIREWSSGFMLGDRLLRPARVVVSSGKAGEAAATETPGSGEGE